MTLTNDTRGRLKHMTMTDERPAGVDTDRPPTVEVPLAVFGPVIKSMSMFAAKDGELPIALTTVRIATKGREVTFEATDRYRLGQATWTHTDAPADLPAIDVLVPAKGLAATVRGWKLDRRANAEAQVVRITVESAAVLVQLMEWGRMTASVTFDRQEVGFPRTERLFPSPPADTLTGVVGVSPQLLAGICKAAEAVAKNASLRLRFHDSPLRPITVEVPTGDDSLTWRALLMPVRLSA